MHVIFMEVSGMYISATSSAMAGGRDRVRFYQAGGPPGGEAEHTPTEDTSHVAVAVSFCNLLSAVPRAYPSPRQPTLCLSLSFYPYSTPRQTRLEYIQRCDDYYHTPISTDPWSGERWTHDAWRGSGRGRGCLNCHTRLHLIADVLFFSSPCCFVSGDGCARHCREEATEISNTTFEAPASGRARPPTHYFPSSTCVQNVRALVCVCVCFL